MPRGPLPNANRRRRNAPTIPTSELPAQGRNAPAPVVPASIELGQAGRDWWEWAWSTSQAAGWSTGDVYVAARRASLEDDLSTISRVENLDAVEVLNAEHMQDVRAMIGRLAALATGRLAIFRAALELDDRLGLTPKALAALRWTIVEDPADGETSDAEQDLGALTVKELRAIARDRKIHVGAGTRKADILSLLEGSPVADIADARRRRLTANAP